MCMVGYASKTLVCRLDQACPSACASIRSCTLLSPHFRTLFCRRKTLHLRHRSGEAHIQHESHLPLPLSLLSSPPTLIHVIPHVIINLTPDCELLRMNSMFKSSEPWLSLSGRHSLLATNNHISATISAHKFLESRFKHTNSHARSKASTTTTTSEQRLFGHSDILFSVF